MSTSKTLAIYLDLSRPMAGFVPLESSVGANAGSSGTNEFRTVAQWVPDHLTRIYPTATLHWRGVGRDIRSLSEYPQFERSLFDATATRLDLAIQEALSDLTAGRSEAAALITDLLGTGELTGALAVSRYLSDWLNSEGVRSGEFHLGLVGVRAAYWGGTGPTCPPRGGLGCWYSERGPGWRRLDSVVVAPFYVLLLGRGAESLATIVESIQGDADRLEIEAVSEMLTASTRPPPARMTCEAYTPNDQERSPQYALRFDESNRYTCARGDQVMLSCEFATGFRPTDVTVREFGGAPTEGFTAEVVPGGNGLDVGVDCRSLQRQEPPPDLLLDIFGTVARASDLPPWEEWSIETDDLAAFPGKTLQLRYFIEEVRLIPISYRVEMPPLLRGSRP